MISKSEKVRIIICSGGAWEVIDGGVLEYIQEAVNVRVLLPMHVTHSGLLSFVARKLGLPDSRSCFRLTYKDPISDDFVELFTNDDVRNFLAVGMQISPEPLRLCVVNSGVGINQPTSYLPDTVSPVTPYQPDQSQYMSPVNPCHPYQSQDLVPVSSYQSHQSQNILPVVPYQSYQNQDIYQTPYQSHQNPYHSYQSHQNPYHSYQTHQNPYHSYQTSESYQTRELPPDYGIRITEIPTEEYNVENPAVVYKSDLDPHYGDVSGDGLYHPNTDEFLGVKLDFSESGSDEEEEGLEEEEGVDGVNIGGENDVGNKFPLGCDLFWGMPPPLPTPFPVLKPKESSAISQGCKRVSVGQIFNSKEDLKLALGLKCLEESYQMKTSRSTPQRFEAVCFSEKCEWRIRATSIEGTKLFQVRKFKDQHTCSRTQLYPNHRQANKKVLGSILKDQMKETGRLYRGKEIVVDVNAHYKISISYMQAWRAKCYAVLLLRGTPEQSFSQLPVYFHYLEKANPGTVTKIETDELGRFERLFVAIGCAIRSFLNNLRPLIVIDGAHLKGPYLGTMFLAVGMDGNNQILPVAYGVGKTESGDSWTWFLSRLKECIGEPANLSIISDRAASINMAIRTVFPTAIHGLCCRHLEMNLRFKAKKDITLEKKLFWKTCKAYRVSDFEEKLAQLRRVLPMGARKTLDDADKTKWSRAYFPGMRYNVMTSNSAESINALSKYARTLPIAMLIDFFRTSLQQWYYDRREYGASLEHDLTPWAEAKVTKRINKSATWTVHPITNYSYEVDDGHRNGVVDLQGRTCSCMQWQISALPCGHVIAVTRFLNMTECNIWAAKCYTTQVYRDTYMEPINPVDPPSAWEFPDEYMTVKPPVMDYKRAGRPSKKDRFPSQGEVPTVPTCTRCNREGHNRRDCPTTLPADVVLREISSRASGSRKKPAKFDLNK